MRNYFGKRDNSDAGEVWCVYADLSGLCWPDSSDRNDCSRLELQSADIPPATSRSTRILSFTYPSDGPNYVALCILKLCALGSMPMSSRDWNAHQLDTTRVSDYSLSDQPITLAMQYCQARTSSTLREVSSTFPSANNSLTTASTIR